jgi:hypothetical protein
MSCIGPLAVSRHMGLWCCTCLGTSFSAELFGMHHLRKKQIAIAHSMSNKLHAGLNDLNNVSGCNYQGEIFHSQSWLIQKHWGLAAAEGHYKKDITRVTAFWTQASCCSWHIAITQTALRSTRVGIWTFFYWSCFTDCRLSVDQQLERCSH